MVALPLKGGEIVLKDSTAPTASLVLHNNRKRPFALQICNRTTGSSLEVLQVWGMRGVTGIARSNHPAFPCVIHVLNMQQSISFSFLTNPHKP
ncbi:hypothetical protein L6452_17589 [Arctium lappa]|uniref:Uncharacterized protein n=1 Tax=Arctium lappa TaxID=4217 RepID=A0ACB9C3U2_ARCLA|nr:hypothetical protein L6452_17589 [Arctium lappa]